MRYKNKLHYTLKYLIIGLPIILIFLSSFNSNLEALGTVVVQLEDLAMLLGDLDVNAWYVTFLDLLGFTDFASSGHYLSILIYYPLYVFWVYLFDLILDIMTFVPKFIHDLGKKEK